MGYTHYWSCDVNSVNDEAWNKAISECEKIISGSSIALDIYSDQNCLSFNGSEDRGQDSEEFSIPRVLKNIDSQFCKIGDYQYGRVVEACLSVLAMAGLSVGTDGSYVDWQEGVSIASTALGREVDNPFQAKQQTA